MNSERGWEGVLMYELKNVLNNVNRSIWHAKLCCIGEGRCLMLCNFAFIARVQLVSVFV